VDVTAQVEEVGVEGVNHESGLRAELSWLRTRGDVAHACKPAPLGLPVFHRLPCLQTMTPPIGQRLHVVGTTCSGKSTLAARLADALQVSVVELDALNWQPGWVALTETDPEAFETRLKEATAGDGWVVAGDYSGFTRRLCWPKLHTVVWLDLSLSLILWRVVSRSWRRWRSKELLWGTNRENFWTHLMLWRGADSLLWWAWTTHEKKRRRMVASMANPQWAHIRFVRLTSVREVERFVRLIDVSLPQPRRHRCRTRPGARDPRPPFQRV
jgi:adenylate kinase family enzyme